MRSFKTIIVVIIALVARELNITNNPEVARLVEVLNARREDLYHFLKEKRVSAEEVAALPYNEKGETSAANIKWNQANADHHAAGFQLEKDRKELEAVVKTGKPWSMSIYDFLIAVIANNQAKFALSAEYGTGMENAFTASDGHQYPKHPHRFRN